MDSLEFFSIIQEGALLESSGLSVKFGYQHCDIVVLNKLRLTQTKRISEECAALNS